MKTAFNRQRLPWVDYARGIALLLVVYRHCVVGINRSGLQVPQYLYNVQEFFFNFRMPAFFLLSGMFLARTLGRSGAAALFRKKAATLLYPYLLWAVVFVTLQIILSGAANTPRSVADYRYILTQPRELDHMWYLLALFNTSVLLLLLLPLLMRWPLVHLSLAFGMHLLSFAFKDFSLLSDPFYHYIFLLAGALLGHRLMVQEEQATPLLALRTFLLLPIFVMGQLLWLSLRPGSLPLQVLFLAITLLACAFFIHCSRLLFRLLPLQWLSEIGRHSLYIYILHFPVIAAWRMVATRVFHVASLPLLIGGSMVLGVIMPVLLYRGGKRWGIERLFSLPLKTSAHG